ncbi:MAG: TlpA family protein disulfide reductase [Halanaerobiales bacterium]|nr:TlpA family protein disulfide reductase [Halanaerobiales bacterium]
MNFNKKNIVLIIGSILVIILVGWYANQIFLSKDTTTNKIEAGVLVGKKAVNFSLPNLSDKSVQLTDYRGSKVFLNFWASWCPPCKQEMPDIQKLANNHEDIKVVTINSQEDKGTVLDFLMKNKYTFTTLLDKDGEITSQYLIRGIPTTFIINEDGVIIEKVSGALSYQKMLKLIES